jgi:hypothetical protein
MQKDIRNGWYLPLYPLVQAAHGTEAETVEGVFVAQAGNYYPATQSISQCLARSHFHLPAAGLTGAP